MAKAGTIRDAAIVARHGKIAWLGPRKNLSSALTARVATDLEGRWITPGLVDCHTHLVYAGNRAEEFARRLRGDSYADIAGDGGGILSTVRATRAAALSALVRQSLPRLDALLAEGVTTVEVKSGYGLSTAAELKMLHAAKALGEHRHVRLAATFLGAHALPGEFAGRADAYIDLVCGEMIPAVARDRLATAVDAFCEHLAFSAAQVDRVFTTAAHYGFGVKLHADQLSAGGGAALAARHGALSADHLEYATADGVAAMAKSNTVAVLLPGAYYTLGGGQRPPVAAFRQARVPMAVATDCNPGSSPLHSLLLAANMACTLFGLSAEEALAGITRHAAQALGMQAYIGTLEVGKRCDLAIWNIESPQSLFYHIGLNPLHERIYNGNGASP